MDYANCLRAIDNRMYKIVVQSNPVLFISALAAGIAAVIYLPQVYPGQMVEIPLSALYVGEVGLALLCTLLFYENASPAQVIKLTSWVLGFSMLVGAIGNFVGQTTQFMPEDQVLVSWIELLIMNAAGLLSTLTLFQLLSPDGLLLRKEKSKPKAVREPKASPAGEVSGGTSEEGEPSTISVKDILEQLDISRINRLEKSLHPEDVSLEALFKEESQAARLAGTGSPETKAIAGPVAGQQEHFRIEPPADDSQTADAIGQANNLLDQVVSKQQADSSGQRPEISDILQELQRDMNSGGSQRSSAETKPDPQAVMSRFQQLLQGKAADEELPPAEASLSEPASDIADSDEIAADIDDAFSKMLPLSAQRECNFEELEKLKESRSMEAIDRDDEMLEPAAIDEDDGGDEPAEVIPEVADKPAKDVKEFGRLSGSFAPVESQTSGSMKTIGKMLLDAQAVENIIKGGDKPRGLTTARVLSAAQGENLGNLLLRINAFPGVEGSIIIGQDGLLIASKVNETVDKEMLGNMSLAIQSNTRQVSDKLELGGLHQIVLQSKDKTVVLTTLEHGVLCVFVAGVRGLNGLMKGIHAAATNQIDTTVAELPELPAVIELQPAPEPPAVKILELPAAELTAPESALEESEVIVPEEVQNLHAPSNLENDEPSSAKPVSADQVKNLIESLIQSQGGPVVTQPGDDSSDNLSKNDSGQPAIDAVQESEEVVSVAHETLSIPAKEVKEFGRLAISGSQQPIDLQATTGSMKTIGKMLIDAQAISNIIKVGEQAKSRGLTTARVISAARGEGIKSLLGQIDNYPGVSGSLIVGHDGLVIASTLSANFDKDILGAMTSAIHSNTQLATKKLELGKLKQAILQSHDKVTVLTDVEVGILAVFCEYREMDKIDGLMSAIESTITT